MARSIYFPTRWIPKDHVPITREGINAVVYIGETETPLKGKVLCGIAYRGKATKPAWNYIFRNEEQRDHTIIEFFESVRKHQEYRQECERKKKEFKTTLKPGDILDTCWGYEQTNREFFQVIDVKNNTITLREIAQQRTETGYMSGQATGLKDQFISEPIKKRVQPGEYVKISECQSASLWDGTPAHYSSYA